MSIRNYIENVTFESISEVLKEIFKYFKNFNVQLNSYIYNCYYLNYKM